MIKEQHYITYRNVASKLYNFYPEEIRVAIEDLTNILEGYGYTTSGDLFYSILSDPQAEIMTAEIFLPIEESFLAIPKEEEVLFRSYFTIKNAIVARILDQFDEQSQVKYWELAAYAENNGMKQATPVFVEYKRTHSGRFYIEMSFGVESRVSAKI
ncbi:DUF5085 family protein [Bacillus sp. T33-2]|uniref:DUF5085 family protein n=1 Tax=Bacillus sp. T33-2 TaxID=2054168 RepID=UPI000C772E5B|nr:DUF5085 family protein [Bacillus sp. T33-2]PLR95920.1 DUF5085 domain-containing protein [Bacillus sp. T33-2]